MLKHGPAELQKQEWWLAEAQAKGDAADRRIRSVKWVRPWLEASSGAIPETWNWFRGERAPRFVAQYFYYRQRCRTCETQLQRARARLNKARALTEIGAEVTVSPALIVERDERWAARQADLAEAEARLKVLLEKQWV